VHGRPFSFGSRDLGRQRPNRTWIEGGVRIVEQLVKHLEPTTMIDVHGCTFAIIGPNRTPSNLSVIVVEEHSSQDGSLRITPQRPAVCPAQPRRLTEEPALSKSRWYPVTNSTQSALVLGSTSVAVSAPRTSASPT
jgi:hypothetical protein